MNGNTDQEKKTRDWFKCSACRQRKKKCEPQPRDWEVAKQKCNHCQAHGLSCGPNRSKIEDPAVIRPVSENPVAQEEGSNRRRSQASVRPRLSAVQSPAYPAGSSIPAVANIERHNTLPFNNGLAEYRSERISALSNEDFGHEASSRLSDFHALGTSLISASHTTTICHLHGPSQPYDHLLVDQELHSLFLYIYRLGIEADARGQCDVARWILFALLHALDKYPGLVDGRKGHVLLKIALIFQRLGHRWESEHILLKVANMYASSAIVPHEDPCYLLAGSFPDSSELIKSTLAKLWQETIGGDHVDLNFTVPPLHRAVQDRNPGIVMAILSDLSEVTSHPATFSQRSTQDTANSMTPATISPGSPQATAIPITPATSYNVAPKGANTEERDFRNRTALFLAVANGDERCCYALIRHGADVNTRDAHGHTALEIAARGGHLNIVRQLTDSNAVVNPDMGCCSSSPLQAAIESDNFNLDLVTHLLSLGAWVGLERYDNKSAVDLAEERGLTQLAANMRQLISDSQHHHPFVIGQYGVNEVLS